MSEKQTTTATRRVQNLAKVSCEGGKARLYAAHHNYLLMC